MSTEVHKEVIIVKQSLSKKIFVKGLKNEAIRILSSSVPLVKFLTFIYFIYLFYL